MRCGVLALQGDWEAHGRALDALGVDAVWVRTAADLDHVDALVLPGGESTTMLHLMERENLTEGVATRVANGMCVLATCAGLILAARRVEPSQTSLGLLDVDVVRNAYGRQVASAVSAVELDPAVGGPPVMEGIFIRAPRLARVGPGVSVLGRCDGEPVLVRGGSVIGATYHPELTSDQRVHRLFLGLVEGRNE